MEAVGVLGGYASGRVMVAIPLPNLAGPKAFLADPLAQFQAERTLRQAGLTLLSIYHSHPGGGVQLSEVDRAFVAHWSIVHVVIALARWHRPDEEMRAYRVNQGTVVDVEIRIEAIAT
jgi:[CysO sulfur-carrier protein]-S-L-cysteine hydrolase